MADGPSRGLVIFGDGFMPHIGEQHSNLHSLVSDGCCGFLALRSPACAENWLPEDLVQLLDLYDEYKENKEFPSISGRFMGMRAAMVTNSGSAGVIGKNAGFMVKSLQEFEQDGRNPELMAAKFLDMIAAGGIQNDTSCFDLLFLHLTADNQLGEPADWIDSVVGKLRSLAAKHVYLVVILGYGDTLVETISDTKDVPCAEFRPRQSYSMKMGNPVDIREDRRLLAVYQQDGVTRRDHCRRLSLEEFRENCGNLTILADRFLHEVAFKLWKAPKYGA